MTVHWIRKLAHCACLLFCLAPAMLAAPAHGSLLPVSSTAFVAPVFDTARMAAVERTAAGAKASADNAWMLTSSALVLLMTGPGLALFYGGLVGKENVLGTVMQSFAMMAVITVIWGVVGYSLAFGPGTSFIGNFHQILNQLVGIAIAWALAIVGTLILLKIVDWVIGLRVDEDDEVQGLDLSQHGEEGYYWEVSS
jgi:ammonia channel protein AmtB